jgi:hypothetical protein
MVKVIMSKITWVISILLVSFIVAAEGCSSETVKRTTYETLQNIRQQECSKTPSVDCEKRERLEAYEDKRQEAK